ncbi:MAG TPA: LuxR C-terminal-related transcriptional regulator [Microterricola sp.]
MSSSVALERGRIAFGAHRWTDAFDALAAADHEGSLTGQDLERLSTAALLTGKETVGIDVATRAHEDFLAHDEVVDAARSAAWIGMFLTTRGDAARGGGWLARAHRLVQESEVANPVAGLLLVPEGFGALNAGDIEGAGRAFEAAWDLGVGFHDRDVLALSQLGQGQVKICLGQLNDGLTLLDEAMVAVTAGEISPVASGIIYCAVIGSCRMAFDLRRAQEWTTALDHWCNDRPDMILFSGMCQVHRAQIYALHGAWSDAFAAARSAQDRALRGDWNATFDALYEQGEVQRLRGELDAAEESYRLANQTGFEPEPGLALLRLAQGRPRQAQSLLRRAADLADPASRRGMLAALVEIELATGDVAAARASADELAVVTPSGAMPMLEAIANQCDGAVLIAEGDAAAALPRLRRAWMQWQQLDAPYEAARCRVLAASACRALGDEELAAMEFDAAQIVFMELGALSELAALDALSRVEHGEAAGPLTVREVEVVRLVADGLTNRAIATALFLSEKTVARHLSNVFAKLGISSRAAATAYAYEQGLVERRS